MKALKKLLPKKCPECQGASFTWHCGQKNLGSAQDGRLRLNEVGTVFYLGCNECSETIKVVDGDKIAELLTEVSNSNSEGS